MVTRNGDSSQGDGDSAGPTTAPPDHLRNRAGNTVFKSGPLLISSKGIGWTSWKKRWFILTRTSLVFFRSDPNVAPPKGGEVNLTLGGIDLNNSGSVVVKEDKKLLTVLFPDGRDGRAFTLKAETSEDLFEWKNALEIALAQAPSAALVMGQNGIFRNDAADEGNAEQCRDKRILNALVIGRPILLALEDIDGTPSFLEKALRFIEQYGVKVEGILRQAADVDDVERRVREYEQGKIELSPGEDAHVIADCVKHVLRELPSSPVPVSCCNALLEAYRSDRSVRINAMRTAMAETFPEPNRLLLQRILKMMQTVASHKAENRMSLSAVAACMAPLILRPLLAGDCELGNDFKMGGDGSVQLLQAAAAANHAQAIIITLLEEYDNIFGDDQLHDGYSSELYSDSEESGSVDEEASDDDELIGDDECCDSQHDLDVDTEEDHDRALSGTCSKSSENNGEDLNNDEVCEGADSPTDSSTVSEIFDANQELSCEPLSLTPQDSIFQRNNNPNGEKNTGPVMPGTESFESLADVSVSVVRDIFPSTTNGHEEIGFDRSFSTPGSTNKENEPVLYAKRRTVWGRTAARRNLSMESIDFPSEDEAVIQKLEVTKADLQNRLAKEEEENMVLQANLEKRKQALHDRRVALEQDVARLQEQLQQERDLREALEAGLGMSSKRFPVSANIDYKTKADLEEIAAAEVEVLNLDQKVSSLHAQLDQERHQNNESVKISQCQYQKTPNHQASLKDHQQKVVETTESAYPHEITHNTSFNGAGSMILSGQEDQYFSNKKPLQKHTVYDISTKSMGVPVTSSTVLPVVVEPPASSNSRNSGTKDEEAPSLSNELSPQKQQLSSISHSNAKSDPPLSSNKQPPPKHEIDSKCHVTETDVPSSTSQQPPQKQQLDSRGHSSALSATNPNASTDSKKCSSKGEGNVSTSSGPSKLITRLNFLKDRRHQIVNDLQNTNKGRGSGGKSDNSPSRSGGKSDNSPSRSTSR